ncbi:hypothetical protein B0H16DRAFT_1738179 [Mycena metata]|uniref:LysM domain-containing protein n=1 Tax=Mycena metata TaxID=1033252 RepID=A0AAD7HIX5_9AGAR|nr:hypothetical protein B0H16DRAFT_1738179 [Mycena metata]
MPAGAVLVSMYAAPHAGRDLPIEFESRVAAATPGMVAVATSTRAWERAARFARGVVRSDAKCGLQIGFNPRCYTSWTARRENGESCFIPEIQNGLSDTQLRALNPWPDTACTIQLGQNICIKNSNVALPPPQTGPPANLNAGSWNNCTTYCTLHILFAFIGFLDESFYKDTVQSGDNCNVIDAKFSIRFSDFLHWNPEVSSTCSNLNIVGYCVGVAGGCQSIYTVANGDSCGAIETKTGLSDAQLRALNPWLDAACIVQIGQNICIKNSNVALPPTGPPANLNPGSWSNCTTHYNIVSGDNWNLIEAKFNIGFSDILRWNPEVTATCSNLNLASYCVLGSSA